MLKETITYTDYEGVKRTETFHFNLTKAELAEMDISTEGGLEKHLKRLIETQDGAEIMAIFKKIITSAYGEKDPTGRRFIKSKELSEAFLQTEAYSDLFIRLVTSAEAAAAFIKGIIPNVEEK